jgi:hypothetical protein
VLVEAGADLASPGAATITAQAIVNRILLRHEVGGSIC